MALSEITRLTNLTKPTARRLHHAPAESELVEQYVEKHRYYIQIWKLTHWARTQPKASDSPYVHQEIKTILIPAVTVAWTRTAFDKLDAMGVEPAIARVWSMARERAGCSTDVGGHHRRRPQKDLAPRGLKGGQDAL
ncbi:hypothetical protein PQR68_07715 [Paraburkholderia agricolaris]|uniref:hypothetical protein n=1 Tax=Paraburkholderia agricolaris TaxID=2152888 RepID=UPI0038BA351C